MSRLTDPNTGTVVCIEGNLEAIYRARGWVDADYQPKAVKATSEKPSEDTDKPATRRNTRRK